MPAASAPRGLAQLPAWAIGPPAPTLRHSRPSSSIPASTSIRCELEKGPASLQKERFHVALKRDERHYIGKEEGPRRTVTSDRQEETVSDVGPADFESLVVTAKSPRVFVHLGVIGRSRRSHHYCMGPSSGSVA
jgi:hypothetical protein